MRRHVGASKVASRTAYAFDQLSSGNSLALVDLFGKCAASSLPISSIASTNASAEFLVLKMRAHCFDNALPELVAAFLMNRVVANNGKLVHARRDENEHRIALARLVHAEPMKFLLRSNQWIDTSICRAES